MSLFQRNRTYAHQNYFCYYFSNFGLEIVFSKGSGEYAGWKNKGDETLGVMVRASWEAFFGKLSTTWLSDGEPYHEMMKVFGHTQREELQAQERGLIKTPYFNFSEALKEATAKQEEEVLRWLREKYGGKFANERFKPKGE